MEASSHIQTIDAKTICLSDAEPRELLDGSKVDHDPWIPKAYSKLSQLLDDAERGPRCLLEVIMFITRQLYYINARDYTDS